MTEPIKTLFVFLLTVLLLPKAIQLIEEKDIKRLKRDQNLSSSACAPYDPPKPNFAGLSRKVSVAKCYEYIWKMKYRSEETARIVECRNYLMDNGTLPRNRNFVIGGHITQPGQYPHMGAIGWKATSGSWIFKCGGSLISETFVLTAAHCSKASARDPSVADVTPKMVRLGDLNIIDVSANYMPPSDAEISRIIVHPKYNPPKKYYDIALMQLAKEVIFTKFVQPACLWTKPDLNGLQTVSVTGWGVVETAGKTTSPDLRAGEVNVVDSSSCEAMLNHSCNRHWCGLQDHQLCAGKLAGGVDACQGDSGGPLQIKLPVPIKDEGNMNVVIGITSFGIGCAQPGLPGVYTRVSAFVDWIESVVWPSQ